MAFNKEDDVDPTRYVRPVNLMGEKIILVVKRHEVVWVFQGFYYTS